MKDFKLLDKPEGNLRDMRDWYLLYIKIISGILKIFEAIV